MATLSVAFVLILFNILNIGSCWQCYTCNSIANPLCEDPVNATLLDTIFCSQRNYGCLKQILPATGVTPKSVQRGCAPIAFCELLESVSDHCSVCAADLCNSSSNLSTAFPILILNLCVIFVYYKY